jgi:hypothetical protein
MRLPISFLERFIIKLFLIMLHRRLTYVVDVNPDGVALNAVDGDIVLQVLAEHLAGQQVVQHNLKQKKYFMN